MTDGTTVQVTCSLGLALHPRDGRSGKELLRAADAGMYRHKRARVAERGRHDAAATL
jgi:GGDEF domain-containing protein